MMLRRRPDRNPEARGSTADTPATIAPPERHWFVPEAPDGYLCAACGLPENNRRRHAPRAA